MAGQQQDADRAGGELGLDFGAPSLPLRDLPVVPQFVGRGITVFQRGGEIRLDFAEPADLASAAVGRVRPCGCS